MPGWEQRGHGGYHGSERVPYSATIGDVFGVRFATTNAALMYTAKGCAALLVPFGNIIKRATGSWDMVFVLSVVANAIAALLALFVLKPMVQPRVGRVPAADVVQIPPAPAV